MGVSDTFQSHTWDQAHMKKKKQREEPKQNKDTDQDKESGKSLAQQHKNTMCHCCGEKGHCMSDCPMKDKHHEKTRQ